MYPYTYLDSSFVGPYYEWFCDLGYPQCDLQVFKDGSWAILEMLNAPTVPSMTKFNWIAKGFRNADISKSRIKRILEQIDPRKQELWDRENKKSNDIEAENNARETFVQERIDYAMDGIRRNPDLMERVAKNGVQEIMPHNIAKHIPESKLRNL